MSLSQLPLPILVLALALAGYACTSDETTSIIGSGGSGGSGASGGGTSTGGDGGGGSGVGGFEPQDEVCDGLDNDGDTTVDEDCTCSGSDTQQCYPMTVPPPEGCRWGEQTCSAGAWGPCTDASLPPDGQETCCTVLGDTPEHALLDDFLGVYPPPNMPKSVAEVTAFTPVADGHGMAWTQVNPGNELVDDQNGGVIEANILAGLAMSKQAAIDSLPVGSTIAATRDEAVIIENLGGSCDGTPSGVGWAWGSILVIAPDESVSELVYLYVGLCSNGDVEAFYYSEEPLLVCEPPVVPR